MNEKQIEVENIVLRAICSVLSKEVLAEVKKEDIQAIAKRIEKDELTCSQILDMTADELFDLIIGQMRFS